MSTMEVAIPPEASERQLLVMVLSRVLVVQQEQRNMAQGFTDLQAAIDRLTAEGGQLDTARDAILTAIQALQTQVSTLQASAATLQQQFEAAGAQASAEAQAVNDAVANIDNVGNSLTAAADSINNPPPAPAPTP